MGRDLVSWDEFESRFEANELKWIADFVVNNMVFVKTTLKIDDTVCISKILAAFWTTLDLFGPADELEAALASRYEKLHQSLRKLFEDEVINKDQTRAILEYSRKTLFGHLQLYLTCL